MTINSALIDAAAKGVLRRPANSYDYGAYETVDQFMYSQSGTIAGMIASPENQQQVRPIIRLIRTAFARTPDTAGLDYWVAGYRGQGNTIGYGGAALVNIMNSMATSTEFQGIYPASMSNVDFVTKVYAQALKRAPDAAGGAFWVNLLDTGQKSRAEMIVEFSQSDECINGTNGAINSFQTDCGNGVSWAYQDPI